MSSVEEVWDAESSSATSSSKKQQQSALHVPKIAALFCIDKPMEETPDSLLILGVQVRNPSLVAGLHDDDDTDFWMLLDSGSMVHTCEVTRGSDLPLLSPTKPLDFRDVQGNSIKHHGLRKVPLMLGDVWQVASEVNFEVSNTAHSVLSLGKMLADGAELVVDSSGGYIKKNGSYIDVQLRDNVLMCKAKRIGGTSSQQPRAESV